MVQTATAAATTLAALAFALSTLERWVDRRKRHELAWTVALSSFALASAAQWWGAAHGWTAGTFRVFYLFGPIVSVPFLALGTVYLLGGRRAGDVTAACVSLVAAFSAGVVFMAPLSGAVVADTLPQGSDVFGALPRILAAVSSGVAALVLVAGALWSAVRLARRRTTRRLAAANVLIAAGTLVLSAGGLLNSIADEMTSFAISHAVGISIVFAGFLTATTRRRAQLRLAAGTSAVRAG
jgi:hypothetical protein